jgi:hypothetical protein
MKTKFYQNPTISLSTSDLENIDCQNPQVECNTNVKIGGGGGYVDLKIQNSRVDLDF